MSDFNTNPDGTIDWLAEAEDAQRRLDTTPRWCLWRRKTHRDAWLACVFMLEEEERHR